MSNNEYVEKSCLLKAETEKAALLQIEGEEHWVPKSQMLEFTVGDGLDYDMNAAGRTAVAAIAKWLCDNRGIPYEESEIVEESEDDKDPEPLNFNDDVPF